MLRSLVGSEMCIRDRLMFDADGCCDIEAVCLAYCHRVPRDKYGFDLVVSEFTSISQRSYRMYQNLREQKLKHIYRKQLKRLDSSVTAVVIDHCVIDDVMNEALQSMIMTEDLFETHFRPWLNQLSSEGVAEKEFVDVGNRVLPLDAKSFFHFATIFQTAAKELEKDGKYSHGQHMTTDHTLTGPRGPKRGGCAGSCSQDKCAIA
eukprot:TRINITY_DN1424_c0_g1_i4.p1 TRINITY_DN1424_c0_g1~~TRINITY_DN1424_c0_g1_i4.p1  ORF type:complete len:205 (+),score=53.77 TRINITY_DN1424_c0_g1_i4:132-746(+)